jgi:hypothetical protein
LQSSTQSSSSTAVPEFPFQAAAIATIV